MRIAGWFALMGLLFITAALAGASSSDNDKNSGFYGGVSGGWTHP